MSDGAVISLAVTIKQAGSVRRTSYRRDKADGEGDSKHSGQVFRRAVLVATVKERKERRSHAAASITTLAFLRKLFIMGNRGLTGASPLASG